MRTIGGKAAGPGALTCSTRAPNSTARGGCRSHRRRADASSSSGAWGAASERAGRQHAPPMGLGRPRHFGLAGRGFARGVAMSAGGSDAPRVAIVGATGAVGQEFLELLAERNFPMASLKLLASKRSAGKEMKFRGEAHAIQELTEESFADVDIALFSAGGGISKKFGPIARDLGCVVVDNSSAFRMTEGVPLVVPEINGDLLDGIDWRPGGEGHIIANPNCSTIIALVAVTPLHREGKVRRMVVSTYQAASGAGQAAMDELALQTSEVLADKPITKEVWPLQYAFNLFSHNSDMDQASGYNEEELKMVNETRKIWSCPDVQITATCIRVPIMRAHAESINLEFESDVTEDRARELLGGAPGVTVLDDRAGNTFPTPLDASFEDDVFVGRIRRDLSAPVGKGLDLFVCGDQIRKGAALNAVQIAERLVAN